MAFNINNFKGAMDRGGVRQNLFEVNFDPSGGSRQGDDIVPFMCQATSIPSSDIGAIPVPYFGRTIFLAGDRTFSPWSVNIINDARFAIRSQLENWHNRLNNRSQNTRATRYRSAEAYKIDATVTQFNAQRQVLKKYKFIGAFPTTIGDIQLSWADNNAIETFPVTFQYDYWEIDNNDFSTIGEAPLAGITVQS
jgi:hypothetical protein